MNKVIHTFAQLSCGQKRAFEMFTVNELVQSWLAPLVDIEPRVGGKYELFWDLNDREYNSTVGCKISAIEQDAFLSFEWKGPKQFNRLMNNADPLTHLVILFTPRNHARTDVHLIHSGWRNSKPWEEARVWFEQAWKSAFEELKKQVHENDFSLAMKGVA